LILFLFLFFQKLDRCQPRHLFIASSYSITAELYRN